MLRSCAASKAVKHYSTYAYQSQPKMHIFIEHCVQDPFHKPNLKQRMIDFVTYLCS